MAQEVSCRLLKRSRSSPSLSFYSAAESQLLLPSRLNHQFPAHFLDAAVQTTTPCNVSQDVSTQTSDQPDTLSCDVAVQTSFYGALPFHWMLLRRRPHPSTSSQHASTQMGSRSASSFSVDTSVQISAHSVVQLDAATQLDLTEFLIGWIYSDRPLDRRHPFCQSPAINTGRTCGTSTAAWT